MQQLIKYSLFDIFHKEAWYILYFFSIIIFNKQITNATWTNKTKTSILYSTDARILITIKIGWKKYDVITQKTDWFHIYFKYDPLSIRMFSKKTMIIYRYYFPPSRRGRHAYPNRNLSKGQRWGSFEFIGRPTITFEGHLRLSIYSQSFLIQEVQLSRYWPFVGYANDFRHSLEFPVQIIDFLL